jgi:integrase
MERHNLTKKFIEQLPASERPGRTYYYDERVRTLVLAVSPRGRKTFTWYKKVGGGASRLNIGTFPEWTVEQARGQASEWNAQAAHGINPADARRTHRLEGTLAAIFEDHVRLITDPARQRGARRAFDRHLGSWRNRKLSALTRHEVEALHHRVGREHPYEANRMLALVSVLFNRALVDGWVGVNPARGVRKFKEQPRKRYLQEAELPRLFAALHATPNRDLADYVQLLLFTGVRESLARKMRWSDILLDDRRPVWRVPTLKGGDAQDVPLTPEAVEVLLRRGAGAAPDQAYVFPGRKNGEPVTTFKTGWKKLLAAAGIANLRRHDLRRTQATWQGTLGVPLQVTTKALGNRTLALAASVYAQADDAAKRDAFTRTNARLLAAMNDGEESQ